jgi:hypothetical protein
MLINFGKQERFFGFLRKLGCLLEWNTALIHYVLDQVFSWVMLPSELAFHRVQDHLIWTSELRVMAVLPRYISAGNRPADGPPMGGGRSAVIPDEL